MDIKYILDVMEAGQNVDHCDVRALVAENARLKQVAEITNDTMRRMVEERAQQSTEEAENRSPIRGNTVSGATTLRVDRLFEVTCDTSQSPAVAVPSTLCKQLEIVSRRLEKDELWVLRDTVNLAIDALQSPRITEQDAAVKAWKDAIETLSKGSENGVHPDDVAVNRFSEAMKIKLAKSRDKGRGGWENPALCKVIDLASMLIDHLPKGDPVDVANFAMMLFFREGGNTALSDAGRALLNKLNDEPESNTPSIEQQLEFVTAERDGIRKHRDQLLERLGNAPHWIAIENPEDMPDDAAYVLWDGCDLSVDFTDTGVDYGTTFFSNGTEATHYLAGLTPPADKPESENKNEWLIEKLSYHKFERDDLSIDECLCYLSSEWKTVRGREARQMILQILALLCDKPESVGGDHV